MASESFDVRNHVFERRHLRIAVFDPRLQRLTGDLVAVHRKRPPLGNSLEARPNLLLVAVREMTKGAFLVEYFLPFGRGPRRSMTRSFRARFCRRVLRHERSGHR